MTFIRHSHGHFYRGIPIYACRHEASLAEGYRWWVAKPHQPSESYGEGGSYRFRSLEAATQFLDMMQLTKDG